MEEFTSRLSKLKRNKYFLAVPVSLFTFIVYLKSLQNTFVDWDDNFYVTANPYITSLNSDFFRWAFTKFYSYNWHPLTWISHAIDYAFWGLNPFGHHMTSNIIHSVNTYLVVILTINLLTAWERKKSFNERKPFDKDWKIVTGITTGLFFGLHPVHVESVAWIAERKDLLCGFFFFLSLIYYIEYANISIVSNNNLFSPRNILQKEYMVSLAFFILALLSKPMAVTLPLVLLIIDYCPLYRFDPFKNIRPVLLEKIPFFLFGISSSFMTYLAQKSGNAIWEEVPFPTRMLVATKSIVAYATNIFLPGGLLPFYPYPRGASLRSPEYLLTTSVVTLVTLVCFYYASKDRRLWATVWSYYIITLVPVLGIIQVGGQFMADRYMYIPSVGPFILFGLFMVVIYDKIITTKIKGLKGSVAIVGVLLIAYMSYLTTLQIGIWKNAVTLWTYAINKEPDNMLFAYYNRGGAFAKEGKYDEAIADYSKVIELNYQEYSKVYIERGIVYLRIGKIEPAMADFKKACDLGNDFGCKALRLYMKY